MKVSLDWLKELVDYKLSPKELADKLSLSSIGVKGQTQQYLELDLTYNRGDLLSLKGVAREVAAITTNLNPPKLTWSKINFSLPKVSVSVENPQLVPVYCIAKIELLQVKPSPMEWVKKLTDSGIRPVNNVADITNLIMVEYGQPMHAFDASSIKDETIIVRCAKKGEHIITLDGKDRILKDGDLLIADPEKPLGIAGVMGGKDSAVSQNSTSILLEAAIFDPVAIRVPSQRLGLYSQASKRFQHGLTRTNLLQALSAAIKMYEDLGGILTAISLTGNLKDHPKTIHLTQKKIDSLIGLEISPSQVESSLKALGFKLASHTPSGNVVWEVTVPYWRLDIQIEEDLIEEVTRMYGYEKIPPKPLAGKLPQKLNQNLPNLIYELKLALAKIGLLEVQTYSFYSSQVILNFKFQGTSLVKIANPISSQTKYLRDNLWPNLLEVVTKNIKNGIKNMAIFELSKVYHPQVMDLPKEPYRLSIALSQTSDNPVSDLYQISQGLGLHLKLVDGSDRKAKEFFHPTRFSFLEKDKKNIGFIAEIHPRYVNKFGVEQRVAVLEIEIESP